MTNSKFDRTMAIHTAKQEIEKKEKALLKARKEVEINANGTSGYSIKEGKNAGKVVGHIKKDKSIIE